MTEKILVVDDDPFARSGLRLYLETLNYRVFEAGDVQTAWDLALAAPPQTAVPLPATTPQTNPTNKIKPITIEMLRFMIVS